MMGRRNQNGRGTKNYIIRQAPDPARIYLMCGWEKTIRKFRRSVLCGHGKFILLTGIGGEEWIEAAKEVGKSLDTGIDTIKIGPGCDYTDLYGAWADEKGIEDNGCLLIRPDLYVAWRQQSIQPDAGELLVQAMRKILCK